jgi:hypothetical protein
LPVLQDSFRGGLEAHPTRKFNFYGTGILPVGPTIKFTLCGTGILPVGPTIKFTFCGTGLLPVLQNSTRCKQTPMQFPIPNYPNV